MAQANQVKLCPHCANSIALDAVKCPYCKAPLSPAPVPEWAERSADPATPSPARPAEPRGGKLIIIGATTAVLLAAAAVYMFTYGPRSERLPGFADQSAELREKDQKIQGLEAELAKLREGNQGSSSQLDDLKAKLSESQKDLAETEKKLADANRELDRLTYSRAAEPAPSPRRADPAPSPRRADPALAPPAPVQARRAAEPGIYETTRATTVFEEPTGSARVLTQIARGTQVTVVRSVGEWLEVRSKHGNPPGFIRVDDAILVSKAN